MANKEKPFEEVFPYLSYRWRYDDGEYSPFAPFTQVRFLASTETDDEERFKAGFNVFMKNDLDAIKITSLPTGREDVVSVDILYTESISSTVYVLKTIELSKEQRYTSSIQDILIKKRMFGSALPDNELARHFDSVPLSAKAQEVTANRLMYGNYVTKFDQGNKELGDGGFRIEVGTTSVATPKSGPSVKTNRDYEVGVVYMDKYGRQGGLLTQKATVENVDGSLFRTPFTNVGRLYLNAKITSNPPPWAVYYRYYVKDISTKFYNLSAHNIYADGENEGDDGAPSVYLQFDSRDRNKITEDTVLIPRRTTFTDSDGLVIDRLNRIPVLAIENEAPDIIKAQVQERKVFPLFSISDRNYRVVDSGGNDDDTTQGQTVIYIKETNAGFDVSQLQAYMNKNDESAVTLDRFSTTAQPIDVSAYTSRLAMKFKVQGGTIGSGTTKLALVDEISYISVSGSQKNAFKITINENLDSEGKIISGTGLQAATGSFTAAEAANSFLNINFFEIGISEEGQNKLKGSFFVKVPKKLDVTSLISDIDAIPVGQTQFDEDGEITRLLTFDFETEGEAESNLDLYWEGASTYKVPIVNGVKTHNTTDLIKWSNCIATVGGAAADEIFRESISILDKFNSTELVKSIRVNTPEPHFAQENRKAGLIFSGLFNPRTGINQFNRFSLADGITKDLDPIYGGIQKLHALDTNLLALCEDKVFRILADKDALFNADDGVNVTATNLVLGQSMVYQGNYGISTHPESFCFFNNNAYFTDAKRGVVLQLTPANGQIFPISSRGMSNFFRDRLHSADKLIGMYDGHKKLYVLSLQGYDETDASIGSESLPNETSDVTLSYSPRIEGWTSRYSFVPEAGITLYNKFYTFKNGKAYLHHDNTANRNTFYGTFTDSEIEIIFNDNPSAVKEFLTLSYEGDEGWTVNKIDTESDDASLTSTWPFVKKENKYFAPIVSREAYYGGTDQGLGSATADDGSTVYKQGERDKSGIKGFYNKVRLENDATTKAELFSINTENFISQI